VTPGPFFNACDYLLGRHLREGRGDRLALTGATAVIMQAGPEPPPTPAMPV
jgi:hypothetical protein